MVQIRWFPFFSQNTDGLTTEIDTPKLHAQPDSVTHSCSGSQVSPRNKKHGAGMGREGKEIGREIRHCRCLFPAASESGNSHRRRVTEPLEKRGCFHIGKR